MKNEYLTVEQLNDIQAQWMALDSKAPKAEIDRVCKLMDKTPKRYLSVSEDLKTAKPIIDGAPVWANFQSIEWGTEYMKKHPSISNAPADIAWCGTIGKWVKLPA